MRICDKAVTYPEFTDLCGKSKQFVTPCEDFRALMLALNKSSSFEDAVDVYVKSTYSDWQDFTWYGAGTIIVVEQKG